MSDLPTTYIWRYTFREWGATVSVGIYDPHRWPKEDPGHRGGFAFGLDADFHILVGANDVRKPVVSQGSMQVSPADARLKHDVYGRIIKLAERAQELLAQGHSIVELEPLLELPSQMVEVDGDGREVQR